MSELINRHVFPIPATVCCTGFWLNARVSCSAHRELTKPDWHFGLAEAGVLTRHQLGGCWDMAGDLHVGF